MFPKISFGFPHKICVVQSNLHRITHLYILPSKVAETEQRLRAEPQRSTLHSVPRTPSRVETKADGVRGIPNDLHQDQPRRHTTRGHVGRHNGNGDEQERNGTMKWTETPQGKRTRSEDCCPGSVDRSDNQLKRRDRCTGTAKAIPTQRKTSTVGTRTTTDTYIEEHD